MNNNRDKASHKRLGFGMMTAAWVLVLGLFTVYFSGFLEQQDNPNRGASGTTNEDGVREVTLRQNRGGHYVAIGKINARPVKFLLDTGATEVSIPGSLADDLDLEAGAAQRVQTANGTITTYATRLNRVDLGTIRLRDVRANINPHMNGDEVLLGMSFLKNLELVQKNKNLTLRQYPRGS